MDYDDPGPNPNFGGNAQIVSLGRKRKRNRQRRLDAFAQAALQGLVASGKYDRIRLAKREDGQIETDPCKRISAIAWKIAVAMCEMTPK